MSTQVAFSREIRPFHAGHPIEGAKRITGMYVIGLSATTPLV